MWPLLAGAMARLARRRGRVALAAVGIAAAAAMTGAAVTVGFNLHGGFARSADAARMPDVIVHFDTRDASLVMARVRSLPNLAAASYQLEFRSQDVRAAGRVPITSGDLFGTVGARHGYKIVAGRDLSGRPDEVVVERGLADQWHLQPGERITVGDAAYGGAVLAVVVGIAVAPDNVAYPLAAGARIWMPYETVRQLDYAGAGKPINAALLWVNDRSQIDLTLEQARSAGYGLGGLTIVTRDGVGVLIDGAAGIVVALLVAVSLAALAAAGVMVAASSRAEVQRRLETIALLRAIGASPRAITAAAGVEAGVVALPAAALGLAVGWWAANGASARLLEALNQLPRGGTVLPLALSLVSIVALVTVASAWPTWRACRRPVASMLRDAELPARDWALPLPGGAVGLGVRMALRRPMRTVATAVVVASSVAVVLLLLALATTLQRLENDPATIGKNYQLTSRSSVRELPRIRRLPGVADAAQRFSTPVADSFQLGESFNLIAYCGHRLAFEAPPLSAGRRASRPGEVEVGQGLATALGLVPGSTLAVQFPDGDEARFRVAGIVRTLDNDGRMAYVQSDHEICTFRGGETAIKLKDGADLAAVTAALNLTGNRPSTVGGVTTRNARFLSVLATLLRTVAIIDGLVCLYVLAQMLVLTALERRAAVGLLRACGADRVQVWLVFFGVAAVVVAVAAPVAVLAERLVLGPQAAQLATSYATVSLRAGTAEVLVSLVGLGVIAAGASAWVARRAMSEPVTRLLRDG